MGGSRKCKVFEDIVREVLKNIIRRVRVIGKIVKEIEMYIGNFIYDKLKGGAKLNSKM